MVLLRESGKPQPAIAEAMGVSLSTVNRAHMAYDDGGLAALKSNNRFMSLVRQAESNASPIRLGSLSDQIPTGGTTAVSRKTPVAGNVRIHRELPPCCRECAMFRERCRRHALHRRRVEHGHLSVGLKIHCLGDGSQFSTLVEGLGGAQKIIDVNYYKHSHASLCLVLPPVGSARSAILLLECIEHFIGSALFSNPEIQIQVCSPGRLGARRSALLAIGFYLGSDTLRRYALGDLATSFADSRGRRLVLYDAAGDFDRNFDWWKESSKHRLVEPQLPFENGRSDLLTGSGSRLDIQNVNLLATLLVHAQYQGYWKQLGMQFQEEMEALLERHLLSGLVDAPWVRTDDPESNDDDGFFAALQELVAYAFEESVRIKKKGRRFPGWHEIRVSSPGILQEVQSLLQSYRSELVRQSRLLDQGGGA
jgi:hypothetical protein